MPHGKGPRQKWISQSAHPKESLRKFEGPDPDKNRDRNGQPTKVNTKDGPCARCGTPVAAREGWLLIIPLGNRPPGYAVMCRTCGG